MTAVGENVVVAGPRLVPELIENPKLFHPLPRPAPQIAVMEQAAAPQPSDAPGAEHGAPSLRVKAGANSRSARGGSNRS